MSGAEWSPYTRRFFMEGLEVEATISISPNEPAPGDERDVWVELHDCTSRAPMLFCMSADQLREFGAAFVKCAAEVTNAINEREEEK